jgi:hypothetical protein
MARTQTDTPTIEPTADAPQDGEQSQATDAQAQSEPTANGTEPAAPAKAKRQNRNTNTVPITLPAALKELLNTKATEEKTTVAQIARNLLAGYVNYTLPVLPARAPKRKFANKEEAANFRKERNAKAKALLAALDSGEIDESTLAKFLAAQAANGNTPAATAPEGADAATAGTPE